MLRLSIPQAKELCIQLLMYYFMVESHKNFCDFFNINFYYTLDIKEYVSKFEEYLYTNKIVFKTSIYDLKSINIILLIFKMIHEDNFELFVLKTIKEELKHKSIILTTNDIKKLFIDIDLHKWIFYLESIANYEKHIIKDFYKPKTFKHESQLVFTIQDIINLLY